MVAYSFQRQFAEPILAGTKGGTIRADRHGRNLGHRVVVGGHAYPGEELQLYTGMRTKQCRLIARKTCIETEPIILDFHAMQIRLEAGTLKRKDELIAFAQFDGFPDFASMANFWIWVHKTRHFSGWHICWLPLPEAVS